ncbi:hypothetical protein ACO0LF_18075 [Undibacterium sp. Di27W]|uniref:hypothetical protein n=1 Tax=Undibacterium sp. Di27W TaxID=3413036 RepID=UPI003BF1E13C
MNKQVRVVIVFISVAVLIAAAWSWHTWHEGETAAGKPVASASVSSPVVTAASASSAASADKEEEIIYMPGYDGRFGLQAAPEAEKFEKTVLEDRAALAQYLTPAQHKQALALLKNQHCESPKITVYSKATLAEKLLVSDCYYATDTGDSMVDPYFDTSYGIMLSVTLGGVFELKAAKHFVYLYETSELVAVTNLKKDGHLQLWLNADTCIPEAEEEPAPAIVASAASTASNTAAPAPDTCKTTGIIEVINHEMRLMKR